MTTPRRPDPVGSRPTLGRTPLPNLSSGPRVQLAAPPPYWPSDEAQAPNLDEAQPRGQWDVVEGSPGLNGGVAAIRRPRRD